MSERGISVLADEEILSLFFARSEQSIRELDKKYGKLCYKIAFNILNNRQDAEECVNDAYLGAWNAIPPARPDPLRPYLCKIVRNLSLKRYYREKAAKRSSVYEVALQEIEHSLSSPHTITAEVETKELARLIEDFLDSLTKENRVLFMRRYAFSDTYADIARLMGISEKNVSVRLTRIRKHLRAYLREREVLA
jgi:RNA polymerase sigma-70 factor (ECF subfamily)